MPKERCKYPCSRCTKHPEPKPEWHAHQYSGEKGQGWVVTRKFARGLQDFLTWERFDEFESEPQTITMSRNQAQAVAKALNDTEWSPFDD